MSERLCELLEKYAEAAGRRATWRTKSSPARTGKDQQRRNHAHQRAKGNHQPQSVVAQRLQSIGHRRIRVERLVVRDSRQHQGPAEPYRIVQTISGRDDPEGQGRAAASCTPPPRSKWNRSRCSVEENDRSPRSGFRENREKAKGFQLSGVDGVRRGQYIEEDRDGRDLHHRHDGVARAPSRTPRTSTHVTREVMSSAGMLKMPFGCPGAENIG